MGISAAEVPNFSLWVSSSDFYKDLHEGIKPFLPEGVTLEIGCVDKGLWMGVHDDWVHPVLSIRIVDLWDLSEEELIERSGILNARRQSDRARRHKLLRKERNARQADKG